MFDRVPGGETARGPPDSRHRPRPGGAGGGIRESVDGQGWHRQAARTSPGAPDSSSANGGDPAHVGGAGPYLSKTGGVRQLARADRGGQDALSIDKEWSEGHGCHGSGAVEGAAGRTGDLGVGEADVVGSVGGTPGAGAAVGLQGVPATGPANAPTITLATMTIPRPTCAARTSALITSRNARIPEPYRSHAASGSAEGPSGHCFTDTLRGGRTDPHAPGAAAVSATTRAVLPGGRCPGAASHGSAPRTGHWSRTAPAPRPGHGRIRAPWPHAGRAAPRDG